MEIDPLIRELGQDQESDTSELVNQAARILIAFSGGWPAGSKEEFLEGLTTVGRRMIAARPTLTPAFHLITELYARASEPSELARVRKAIRTAAVEFTEGFAARCAKIAKQGAALLEGAGRVLTLGRAGAVESALLEATGVGALAGVVIGEGRPHLDGRRLATRLAEAGAIGVRIVPDAALASYLPEVDLVIVSSACVRGQGVVARSGVTALAAAARAQGTPVYALAGILRLLPGESTMPDPVRPADTAAVWADPPEGVIVENPGHESVPLKAFRGVVLESGPLGAFEMEERIRGMPVPPWVTS